MNRKGGARVRACSGSTWPRSSRLCAMLLEPSVAGLHVHRPAGTGEHVCAPCLHVRCACMRSGHFMQPFAIRARVVAPPCTCGLLLAVPAETHQYPHRAVHSNVCTQHTRSTIHVHDTSHATYMYATTSHSLQSSHFFCRGIGARPLLLPPNPSQQLPPCRSPGSWRSGRVSACS